MYIHDVLKIIMTSKFNCIFYTAGERHKGSQTECGVCRKRVWQSASHICVSPRRSWQECLSTSAGYETDNGAIHSIQFTSMLLMT